MRFNGKVLHFQRFLPQCSDGKLSGFSNYPDPGSDPDPNLNYPDPEKCVELDSKNKKTNTFYAKL